MRIVVEGLPASGKSTVLKLLAAKFQDKTVIVNEPLDAWCGENAIKHNFLSAFYKNREKGTFASFMFQFFAILTMLENQFVGSGERNKVVIQERSIFSSISMFASCLHKNKGLADQEFFILNQLYSSMVRHIKFKVDAIVFLNIHPLLAVRRAEQRNRGEEKIGLDVDYLYQLKHEFNMTLKPAMVKLFPNARIFQVNRNWNLRFLKSTHYRAIANFIAANLH